MGKFPTEHISRKKAGETGWGGGRKRNNGRHHLQLAFLPFSVPPPHGERTEAQACSTNSKWHRHIIAKPLKRIKTKNPGEN